MTSWVDDLIEIYGTPSTETSEFPEITPAEPTQDSSRKSAPTIVIPKVSTATIVVSAVAVISGVAGIGAMTMSYASSDSTDVPAPAFSCTTKQSDDLKTTDGVFGSYQRALAAGESVQDFLSEKSPLYGQKWSISADPDLIVCVEPILVDLHKLDTETVIYDPATDSAVVYTQRVSFSLTDKGPRIKEIIDLDREEE